MTKAFSPQDYLIYSGTYFRAEWYYTVDGKMPAYEYYCALDQDSQMRLEEMLQYYCDNPYGTILPNSMYKIEDKKNKIYAFKPKKERFFNFAAVGGVLILTNAFRKHSQKMGKIDLEQLKISARYRMDYLNRTQDGIYYAY